MGKRYIFIVATGIIALFTSFEEKADVSGTPIEDTKIHYHFGLTVNPTANSQLVTYALVGVQNDKIVGSRIITEQTFLLQAIGKQVSAANPARSNLFYENAVTDCGAVLDTLMDKYIGKNCLMLDNLWKLRYKRNPMYRSTYDGSEATSGWARYNYRPSVGQYMILGEYGLEYFPQFIYGPNMFKLLKDMQSQSWIDNYRNA